MARIVRFFKTLRNNWKKSLFGSAALTYGVSYGRDAYETETLMRQYCEDAVKLGDETLPLKAKPRHITVILNPIANKRKSKKLFEKYCEPLLHLAGIAVTVLTTDSEAHARKLIAELNVPTDGILVAGGDGTLSEVVTGMMRKYDRNIAHVRRCPIGVLPLGERSSIASTENLEKPDGSLLAEAKQLADATMKLIRGNTKLIDVIELQQIQEAKDAETEPAKPVYALGSLEWGALRDAEARKSKYWYYGSLRSYATYVFNGYKSDLNWDCNGTLIYSEPCKGCSHCYKDKIIANDESSKNRRWWHAFLPRTSTRSSIEVENYSKIINDKCALQHEVPLSTTLLALFTNNLSKDSESSVPSFNVNLGPEKLDYANFVSDGWSREKGERSAVATIQAKEIELRPNVEDDSEKPQKHFYVDNEEYELKPVKVKLLEKSVSVFC